MVSIAPTNGSIEALVDEIRGKVESSKWEQGTSLQMVLGPNEVGMKLGGGSTNSLQVSGEFSYGVTTQEIDRIARKLIEDLGKLLCLREAASCQVTCMRKFKPADNPEAVMSFVPGVLENRLEFAVIP